MSESASNSESNLEVFSSKAVEQLVGANMQQFIALLCERPEMLRQVQSVVVLAKKAKELEELQAMKSIQEQTQSVSAVCKDQKAFQKALKLVTGPYNPENEASLKVLLSSTVAASSLGTDNESLLKKALDYLGTKERVELRWPWILVQEGANIGPQEVKALLSLYKLRSDPEGDSRKLVEVVFAKKMPWSEIEAGCKEELSNFGGSLLAFFKTRGNADAYGGWGEKTWNNFCNLVNSGVMLPKSEKVGYGSSENPFWQNMMAQEIKYEQDAQNNPKNVVVCNKARQRAFELMAQRQWFSNQARTNVEDNLDPKIDAGIMCGESNRTYTTPSRAFVRDCVLKPSSVPIFKMLCEYEREHGLEQPLDPLGRSRLFFVNERSRCVRMREAEEKNVLLEMAQMCIDFGDNPSWVNAQNPLAKSCEMLRPLIGSNLSRQLLEESIQKPVSNTSLEIKKSRLL